MALHWTPKAAGDVREYRWTLPDSITSLVATVSSGTATIVAEIDGTDAVYTVTGGAAGVVQQFALSAVLADETITETAYLPIRATTDALGNTAHDVCAFALSKIFGIGEEPDADSAVKALEILNDMLAEWRMDGMDIGAPAVLALTDTLAIRDEFLAPLKYNLTVRVAEDYGREISAIVASNAERGKMLIANRLLAFSPLSFEGPNLPHQPMAGINDL